MTSIQSLQADARAKFKDERGKYTLYNDQLLTLDEIILSTVRAVREEVVPDNLDPVDHFDAGYIACLKEINRRFDSLL